MAHRPANSPERRQYKILKQKKIIANKMTRLENKLNKIGTDKDTTKTTEETKKVKKTTLNTPDTVNETVVPESKE